MTQTESHCNLRSSHKPQVDICPKATHLRGSHLLYFSPLLLKEHCPRKFQKESDSCSDLALYCKMLILLRSIGMQEELPPLLAGLLASPMVHSSRTSTPISKVPSSGQFFGSLLQPGCWSPAESGVVSASLPLTPLFREKSPKQSYPFIPVQTRDNIGSLNQYCARPFGKTSSQISLFLLFRDKGVSFLSSGYLFASGSLSSVGITGMNHDTRLRNIFVLFSFVCFVEAETLV